MRIADIAKDQAILQEARKCAAEILEKDYELQLAENEPLRNYIENTSKQSNKTKWSLIS
jgi:ATP-dependent DNA helicase RecG